MQIHWQQHWKYRLPSGSCTKTSFNFPKRSNYCFIYNHEIYIYIKNPVSVFKCSYYHCQSSSLQILCMFILEAKNQTACIACQQGKTSLFPMNVYECTGILTSRFGSFFKYFLDCRACIEHGELFLFRNMMKIRMCQCGRAGEAMAVLS